MLDDWLMGANASLAIIINLTLFLVAVTVVSIYTVKQLKSERNRLIGVVQRLKEKSENINKNPESTNIQNISVEFEEQQQRIEALTRLHDQQQQLILNLSSEDAPRDAKKAAKQLIEESAKSALLITSLQDDLSRNKNNVLRLAERVRDGNDLRVQLDDLKAIEQSQQATINSLKNQVKTAQLSATPSNTPDKAGSNQAVDKNNKKLNEQVDTLTKNILKQRNYSLELRTKLEATSQREQEYVMQIKMLEDRFDEGVDSQLLANLETEIEQLKDELDRTLREKEFIETHLVTMDEMTDDTSETKEALERAYREIETLEKFFGEFDETDTEKNQQADTPHVIVEEFSEKSNSIVDTREISKAKRNSVIKTSSINLYSILDDFYSTLSDDHLELVAKSDIRVPSAIDQWVMVTLSEQDILLCGMTKKLNGLLAQKMFVLTPEQLGEEELKDAIGELGNILGGNIVNTHYIESEVGLPKHIDTVEATNYLQAETILTENLLKSRVEFAYVSVITINR
jgi:hypothetical protein